MRVSPRVAPADAELQKSIRRKFLGRGGYGEVWLVEHLGQLEAHKYLVKGTGNQQQRAFREALNTRRIKHANIVQVFGVEEDDGQAVLRMEHVAGRDLARVVDEDGALPVERLMPLAIQVADALAVAHEQGIVHQDIKPSNLLLRENGTDVVVTDFGISGILRAEDESGELGPGTSPYFVSPQVHLTRQGATAQSDIWSLGVTLYFLATGGFPFPFDQMEARVAVRQPPIDPCPLWPHVPPEFWELLGRMLSEDRERAFGSMAGVKQALEHNHRTITCPDCGNTAPMDAVQGQCPAVACRKERIAWLKAGTIERRAAETSLCECRFEDCAAACGRAEQEFRRAKSPLAEAMKRLGGECPNLAREHERLAGGARALLEADRLVACVRAVHDARRRFSRSAELRATRAAARERITALHSGLEERVGALLRGRRFEEARESVNRLDQVLGDPLARRELELALGKVPETFERLYRKVEEKGDLYFTLGQRAKQHIEQFRFTEASEVYSRLETEFPDQEHLAMIARLSEAKDAFKRATQVADDVLHGLVVEPQRIAQQERVPLAEVRDACRALLERFPPATYSTFERFRKTLELADLGAQGLARYVTERQAEAEGLRQTGRLGGERRVLELARGVLERADTFDSAQREAVASRIRELDSLLDRARQRYQEGQEALERHEFAKAVALFGDTGTLAPAEYPDLADLQREALEGKGRQVELAEQVSHGLGEIDAGRFTLESAQESLRQAEELLSASDATSREQYMKALSVAAWRLLGSQTGHLDPASETEVPDPADFIAQYLEPLVHVLPVERWAELLALSPELRREICVLFQHAIARIGGEPPARLVSLERLSDRIVELAGLLQDCSPPHLSVHPCVAVARALVAAVGEVDRKRRPPVLGQALRLMQAMKIACPPEASRDLQRSIETLERQRKGLALKALALRIASNPRVAWSTTGVILVAAGLLAWTRFESGSRRMLDKVTAIDGWLEVLVQRGDSKRVWTEIGELLETPDNEKGVQQRLGQELTNYAVVRLAAATHALSDPTSGSLLPWLAEEFKPLKDAVGEHSTGNLHDTLRQVEIALASLEWSAVEKSLMHFDATDGLGKALKQFAAAEFRRACCIEMISKSEAAARGEEDAKGYVADLDRLLSELQGLALEDMPKREDGAELQNAIIDAINLVIDDPGEGQGP